ncbi:hypothetical protein SI65_08525 [Aspergillus cristatus]|uniref:PEBP-like protein n=1 Tax=Aspergillus cristatus TaxID=573508 RepID=A0A1E3B5L0_ASPCR|nr:hypothetical protein SI65_08525 [Aspergillus cristatus]
MSSITTIEQALSQVENDPSKVLGLKIGPHTTPNHPIDAPFPSLPILGPILHWIQPDIQVQQIASPSTSASSTLKMTAPFVANYIGPALPPGSAPHRYVFLLYEQPEGFMGEKYAPPGGKEL